MAQINPSEWDKFLAQYPNSHILQTSAWGQLKAEFGWQVICVATRDCGAQLMIKQILPGVRFAYIPKGPVGINWSQLWPEIDAICHDSKSIFLKIEPDFWESVDENSNFPAAQLLPNLVQSKHSIQPLQTLIIDIRGEESQILGRMKQKPATISILHSRKM